VVQCSVRRIPRELWEQIKTAYDFAAEEILDRADQVERYDRIARQNYGLDIPAPGSGAVNLNVTGGRPVVQINQKNE
jgi:hypothetical protein